MNPAIPSGTHLGRYEVLSQLGAGGMGEVYLAKDTQLGRKVALKVLPAGFAQDKQRLQRFIQEARTASTLSHPNVAHIYEVLEAEGSKLIAMEHVEGQTLRQRLAATRIEINDALETAVQVASALAAAHASGIIHRDIKPENIMLRPDGFVKVLDFGLAKLDAKLSPQQASDSDASTLIVTDPGVVMGTVSYMSPEQARGLLVDERTDIFSLGVVLYEMITGRRPFEGATTSHVIVSILERHPAPLVENLPEASDELRELNKVVMKALEKDAEERYQTIKDMAVDLRKLKRRLEVKGELERSAPPETSGVEIKSGSAVLEKSEDITDARTNVVSTAPPTSSVEYVVSGIRRHKIAVSIVAALLIITMTGLGYALYRLFFQPKDNTTPAFHSMKLARLTNTGQATLAAISPDGKYVVHVMNDGEKRSLWLRNVATSSNVQISPPAEVGYHHLIFSKDGNFIYYTSSEVNKEGIDLYRVPVLGGDARKIITDLGVGWIDFSPDGQRIAFDRADSSRNEDTLMIANADGTGERKLVTHKAELWFGPAAWSPDGKVIVSAQGNYAAEGFYMTLVAVSAESGTEKAVSSQRWTFIENVAWLTDANGLVISASELGTIVPQLWQISYPNGESRKVTNDLNNYRGISLTADSGTLVTVQSETIANLWVSSSWTEGTLKQITNGGIYTLPTWTSDGKILYSTRGSGNVGLWVMEADGSGQRQLTSGQHLDGYPVATPDGRNIVYLSFREGISLWKIGINGGEAKQLAHHLGGSYPIHLSPDGKWVIYTKNSDLKEALWKISIEGGEAVQLTQSFLATAPAVSPDGKSIVCFYIDQPMGKKQLALIPFEGGPPLKTFDLPQSLYQLSNLRWTTDGRAVAYIDTRQNVSNIWEQPIEGGQPRQLTDFKSDRIFYFDWSGDSKMLVLSRGSISNDVVQISNFR